MVESFAPRSGADEGAARRREEARERHFWGEFADSASVSAVQAERLDVYAAARLRLLGNVGGKDILDLGCGGGQSAALLGLRRAKGTAVDISEQCARLTVTRARLSGVAHRVGAHVMSAYALAFPAASFDLVHGQDILHHLDVEAAGRAIKQVLRPGGRAVFQENNANNPVLMVARRLCGPFGIPKWSSDDEYPLSRAEIQALGNIFDGAIEVHYPPLEFFRLVDMKLFSYRNRAVNTACDRLDDFFYRHVPAVRPYGYKQLIVLHKLP